MYPVSCTKGLRSISPLYLGLHSSVLDHINGRYREGASPTREQLHVSLGLDGGQVVPVILGADLSTGVLAFGVLRGAPWLVEPRPCLCGNTLSHTESELAV